MPGLIYIEEDPKGGIAVMGYGIILAAGITVPADGKPGYAVGCRFVHLDGGDATATYVNEGSSTSADFNALDGA